MQRVFNNNMFGPTAALAGSSSMSQGRLHVPGTSGVKGGTSSAAARQRELDSQLHDLLGAEEDWDDEEEEEEGGEKERRVGGDDGDVTGVMSAPTSLAEEGSQKASELSALDDLDAGLFGALSHNHGKRGERETKPSHNKIESRTQQRVPSSDTLFSKRQPTHKTPTVSTTTESLAKDKDSAVVKTTKPPRNTTPAKPMSTEIDDDILSLLAVDVGESTNQTRPRPKFQMKPASSRQKDNTTTSDVATSNVPDPQPAIEEQLEPERTSEKAEERPKSKRGHLQSSEKPSQSTATTSIASGSSFGMDILKLDHSPERTGEGGTKRMGMSGKVERNGETLRGVGNGGSHSGSGVEFEDEDENMLMGLGLSNGDVPPRPRRLDYQSQKKIPSTMSDQLKTSGELSQSTKGSEIGSRRNQEGESGKDEGSYAFGGYLPSVASGTRQVGLPVSETRSSRHLEAGFRSTRQRSLRGDKEPETTGHVHATHKTRQSVSEQRQKQGPTEDIGSAKKSVRFADEVESEGISLSNDTSTSSQPEPDKSHDPLLIAQRTSRKERGEGGNEALMEMEANKELPQAKDTVREEEGDSSREGRSDSKLEHPVFPWQQRKRDRGLVDGQIVANPLHMERLALSSKHNIPAREPQPVKGAEERQRLHTSTGSDAPLSRTQTLPEKQREEQGKQPKEVGIDFQSKQHNSVSKGEREKRTQNEARVKSLECQLQVSEQQKQSLEKSLRSVEEEKKELQTCLQSKEQELTSQLEELRAKLQRLELERDQLQQSVETMKTHHTEEQAHKDKSHSDRIQALEESFHRREEKWKEELDAETSRHKERLEQLERDKTDSVLTLRKKIATLETEKTNEISQLQDIHRSSVADIKREHELDLHRVKDLHRQEVEALKAAHSHTQRLSELSSLVEEATHGVSGLQNRMEQAHREGLESSHQYSQTHQEHLRVLEERLSKQYRDMESERGVLRSLAGRLESQLSEKTQAIERERWSVQQEMARLRAGEKALEEERSRSLARIEQEKRDLIESKERFLAEQQKLLSECLSERHSLVSERTQLAAQQRRIAEAEQRRHEMEGELEASLARAKEEQAHMATEAARLQQLESTLRAESSRVKQERESVEVERASLLEQMNCLRQREEEAKRQSQSAATLRKEGEQMIQATQRLKAELAGQVEALKKERKELDQRETELASERLAFARERRELEDSQFAQPDSLYHHTEPILTSTHTQNTHSLSPPPPPSSLPDISALHHSLPPLLRLNSSFNHTHHHLHQQRRDENTHSSSLTSSLQHSRQLRSMAQEVEKDDLDLRREREFLELVQHQNSLLLSDHYRRLHPVNN